VSKIVFPETTNLYQGKAMLIKTLLNKVERFKSFIYHSIGVLLVDGVEALVVGIKLRLNSQLICP
jgi:hypothetical protein